MITKEYIETLANCCTAACRIDLTTRTALEELVRSALFVIAERDALEKQRERIINRINACVMDAVCDFPALSGSVQAPALEVLEGGKHGKV